MDRSLILLALALSGVWLLLDMAVGKNRVGAFLSTLFPWYSAGGGVSAPAQTVPTVDPIPTKSAGYAGGGGGGTR